MTTSKSYSVLDRLLDPVTHCLPPDAARRLVNLQPDRDLQERIDLLADRCTEGALSPEEREEYETYVRAVHIVSILQAKARRLLDAQTTS